MLPTLFVSYGSTDMGLTPSPTRDFLSALGKSLDRPRAILTVSAHFIDEEPTLTAHANLPRVHDLRGFPDKLYEMTYPAPGEPALAQQVAERVTNTRMPAHLDRLRGLDHGAWTAIRLMGRGAEIPVLQLSLVRSGDAGHHYRLGQALRGSAAQGVLVLGSGAGVFGW
jgi:4,5-DOPA dioxygenase extradiol